MKARITKSPFVALALAVLITALAFAQNEADSTKTPLPASAATVTLDDLTWLVGRWVGNAFGGIGEEVWNPALGGSMTGSYKLVVEDKVVFYELMTITMGTDGPTLRLKHFNADLTGWEEKNDVISFAFRDTDKEEINFEGLTYRKLAADSLRIVLTTKDKEGEVDRTVIDCRRTEK